jgi:hypothetical protein
MNRLSPVSTLLPAFKSWPKIPDFALNHLENRFHLDLIVHHHKAWISNDNFLDLARSLHIAFLLQISGNLFRVLS